MKAIWLALVVASLPIGCRRSLNVTTLAGSQLPSYADGVGTLARFDSPGCIVQGSDGALYLTDGANESIRRIAADGTTLTVTGNGMSGFQDGSGQPPRQGTARLFRPTCLVVDRSGDLIFADSGNNAIRRCRLPDGSVTTIVGDGSVPAGFIDGPFATARFSGPSNLAFDASANVLYVTEVFNHAIRRIDLEHGQVTTVAGNGEPGFANGLGGRNGPARFNRPTGIVLDGRGDLLVSDTQNHVVRRISPDGSVTTFAGIPGVSGYLEGTGSGAVFSQPVGLALGHDGVLYVADAGNHLVRGIRPDGVTSLLAGVPYGRAVPDPAHNDDGPAETAMFRTPTHLAVGSDDALYIADYHRIRVVR